MAPGVCMICNKVSETLYTCSICGRTVCPKHYDPVHKVCIQCKGGRQLT